ncbi:glycine-rich domain-containing protein-like [Massilia sp. ST3]|uniref:glycine-rich domain-containing protein n=1 Tax=Massilia sp. ST3 TaxID=2824903 RepID=UPI001E619B64|nr:glycine-rich domain-containing protein-like [Massilia sp. ST3]
MKLMHVESGEGWSEVRANAVEAEYRRFLFLMKKYPDEQASPTVDVDTFWHYHILDTMKYARDCEQVFGYFLHHYPYVGIGEGAVEGEQVRAGERMRELVAAEFGVVSSGQEAWCAAPGKPQLEAGDAAWCAAPGKALVQGETAWCAAPGKQAAQGKDTAWCAAPSKQATQGCDTAWCAAPGKTLAKDSDTAWCAAPGKVLAEAVKTAWCAAPGKALATANQTAWCASPGKALLAA